MRNRLIRFLFSFLALLTIVALARADEAPATIEQINSRLDRARATLDEVTKALAEPQQTDGTLRLLRERVSSLPADLEAVIEKLTPRLAAVDARLNELGAPPAAAPAAPAPAKPDAAKPSEKGAAKPAETKPSLAPEKAPEAKSTGAKPQEKQEKKPAPVAPAPPVGGDSAAAASVNAEWAEQRKLYDDTDATLKRARALLLESRQTLVSIVARQRDLFAKTLFLQTNGLLSPSLWREAAREAPAFLSASGAFLSERAANFSSRLGDGRTAAFAGLVLLIFLCIPPALWLARRVLARGGAKTPPTPFKKAAGAAWTALVTAAVPVAAVGALGATLEGFDLVDATLAPVLMRVFEGVARTAAAYALARAVFAPNAPQWRLLDPGDARAARLTRLAVTVAAILTAARVVEQLEETVQAALPIVVVTRGLAAALVAGFIAAALLTKPKEAETADSAPRRDWLTFLRAFGYAVVATILVACLIGYVTFANFLIVQAGWIAGVVALLYIVRGVATTGVEATLAPAGSVGRAMTSGLGLRQEQLGQIAVLLSGFSTLAAFGLAAFFAVAPLGVQSGDLLSAMRSAFFSFKVGGVTISVSGVLTALAIFTVTLTAAQAFRRWLDTRFLPLTRLDLGLRHSIGSTLGYAGFLLAAGLALSNLGLDFGKMAIVAGALSVGIGFGLQSIVNNFVSGLILLWERAIRVGDWVVVGDEQGYVKRINVRSTEIETFDRATMIVPNSNLVAGVVKNWLRGDKVGRIKIALAPHAGVDPETMRDVLLAAARAQESVLRIPAPQVMFLGMEASAFKFELWCYVEDVEKSTRVRSDLHFDLHKRLAEAGVTIAAAASPPAPAILQIPGLEKLAAVAALGGFAMDKALEMDEEPLEEERQMEKQEA